MKLIRNVDAKKSSNSTCWSFFFVVKNFTYREIFLFVDK